MNEGRMLVGSDIELMPRDIAAGMNFKDWWHEWMGTLISLPPKGERRQLPQGFWLHRDGLSVEYGIPPVDSLDEFMSALSVGKTVVERSCRRVLTAVDWFNIAPIIDDDDMAEYLELGCSPDFVVTGNSSWEEREVPDGATEASTRECGGHIHLSLPPIFLEDKQLTAQFIRELDGVIYPLVTMNLGDYRSWYRHRNLFRFTSYGVEYRSLGASSLFSNDAERHLSLVFDMLRSVWEV